MSKRPASPSEDSSKKAKTHCQAAVNVCQSEPTSERSVEQKPPSSLLTEVDAKHFLEVLKQVSLDKYMRVVVLMRPYKEASFARKRDIVRLVTNLLADDHKLLQGFLQFIKPKQREAYGLEITEN